jgi:hypothetical protein
MEPLTCSWGFGTGNVGNGAPREAGKAAFEASRMLWRAGNGRHYGAAVTWMGSVRQADTQIRSRPGARGWATGFAAIYELSKVQHREANWRAERFGPIRISPLQ